MNIEDFGSDGYTYVRGDAQRYQTRRVRTIRPAERETNEQFEQRMDTMALAILAMAGVDAVELHMDVSSGAITRCTVTITEAPRPAPIARDARPAGGRFGSRGARGQGLGVRG